jgi:hypothetical protein
MKNDLADLADRTILYFEKGVLASYRDDSHQYEVLTDHFEGSVSIRSDYYETLPEDDRALKNLDIRFGFRAKRDGTLAIAVWAPDITERAGDEHQRRWMAFAVSKDEFPEELDRRFSLWASRILGGSWDVDDGPLARMRLTVSEINSLTEEAVGKQLFKAESSSTLTFPNGENNRAYGQAHSAIYGFIIDGLDKSTMVTLAPKLGVKLKNRLESERPLTALGKIVTDAAVLLAIEGPMGQVSKARGTAAHGVQPAPLAFPAFDRFFADAEAVVSGLLNSGISSLPPSILTSRAAWNGDSGKGGSPNSTRRGARNRTTRSIRCGMSWAGRSRPLTTDSENREEEFTTAK